ncbi:MAG: hypothetical protein WBR26_23830 [Candidatus Acidiferrum sp.]
MINLPLVVLSLASFSSARPAFATELKPDTTRAFDQYVEGTEARINSEAAEPDHFFLFDALPDDQRAAMIARLKKGEIIAQPMTTRENGEPIHVPGGLVHHWLAVAFIPGATAEQALTLSQDFSRDPELYKPDIQDARVLSRHGDDFRVFMRLYRHAIVSVAYNAEFDVNYFIPDSSRNYNFQRSTKIQEIENPGRPDEQDYPVGKDHGYLWRLNLYTLCQNRDGGLYMQVEFLALSRTVPAIFAWLVDPYIHSIPRDYLKHFLDTTRKALISNTLPGAETH